jgi:hypothetical protein
VCRWIHGWRVQGRIGRRLPDYRLSLGVHSHAMCVSPESLLHVSLALTILLSVPVMR